MTSLPSMMRTDAHLMWRKTTEPEGGWKARRRKRLPVALRRGGMAASTVLSIGKAANRCVSAQRRKAEPAGIGLKARPDENTESEAFRRGRQRGLGWSLPLVKSASNASSALRTTAKPIVVEGPYGRVNPIQSASVPRRRRPPTPPPTGGHANRGASALRQAPTLRGGRSGSPARRECPL